MNVVRQKLQWIITVLVVTVLLAGAYRIVQERNRAFVTSGQSSSSMPMH